MSTFHHFKEWIRYQRKAVSRHGVHSPFVYDFIEAVLRNGKGGLKDRIISYFGDYALAEDLWGFEGNITEDTIIILNSIHKNEHTSGQWRALCAQPQVTLSIDLFELGLLFFKKDFLQKQHFVLKR